MSETTGIAPRPLLIAATLTAAVALAVSSGSVRANADGFPGDSSYLDSASTFAIVAQSTVTNVFGAPNPPAETVVSGNVALSAGTSVTGFGGGEGTVSNGAIYIHNTPAGDTTAQTAVADAVEARIAADGLVPTGSHVASVVDLAGATPVPGVYSANEYLLNGTITLTGDWDDVWVFKSSSTLTTGSASVVSLVGANPCNVYWQLDTAGTLGTNSTFVGTIFAGTSITANSGASVQGRLLAEAAVTLDHNAISLPTCLTAPPVVTPPVTTPAGGGTTTPAARLAATGADTSGSVAALLAILGGTVLLAVRRSLRKA